MATVNSISTAASNEDETCVGESVDAKDDKTCAEEDVSPNADKSSAEHLARPHEDESCADESVGESTEFTNQSEEIAKEALANPLPSASEGRDHRDTLPTVVVF